ncbi:MAG: NAD-dependent epimerase/dehydratase family protein [Acidobacteriota bacterium]|nr:NAD-dependent epimerase/dehydratase family protein [Acidobacteriota bacterium]
MTIATTKKSVRDIDELDDLLSLPTPETVEAMSRLKGDIVILGVGGKMGPTLARMVKRASDLGGVSRRVIGVSRFSSASLPAQLQSWGIETHSCDLLDAGTYAQLPDAANVVFMAGMKFGSTHQEARTWAMNAFTPGLVSERYRDSRIAVFSTGNVYGLSPVTIGGSVETDDVRPVGDYAMSCLGRERIFEHFSRTYQVPISIIRLNYATELRYGVLLDIAERVLAGIPVSLHMGHLNTIWQADATAMSLRSLLHVSSPPFVINIAGPEQMSVRRIASNFAERFGKDVLFEGAVSEDAILSNAQKAFYLFGYPTVSVNQMIEWVADWALRGGAKLGKPTHFDVRSGDF